MLSNYWIDSVNLTGDHQSPMVTVNPDLHLPLKFFSAISRFSTFGLLGSGGHLPHGKRDFDGRQGKDSSPCKLFFYKWFF